MLEMVEEPSRRRDEDVGAAAERRLLSAMATPPKMAAPPIGVKRASSRRCSSICAASSRVGASTRARVFPRACPIKRFRIGNRKAAVFPLRSSRRRERRAPGTPAEWRPSEWVLER